MFLLLAQAATDAAKAASPPAPAAALPDAAKVVAELARKPVDTLAKWSDHIGEFAITRGPGIFAALVILVIGWMLARWARRLVMRGTERARVDATLGKFFGNITKWSILVFVIVTCLGTVGINTTGFAAVIAASGLAIGLALQGNLGNLASGVLLMIFRPFKIGDAVIVAGQAGIVDGIDLFTTNLDTGDMRRIIVPNGAIFSGVIENQTHHYRRQAVVAVPISPAASLDEAHRTLEAALQRVLKTVPGVMADPPPAAVLAELSPVVIWNVSVWAETARFGGVRPALLREIKLAIDAAKIGPVGPSMDVRIKEMPGQLQA